MRLDPRLSRSALSRFHMANGVIHPAAARAALITPEISINFNQLRIIYLVLADSP